MKDKISNRASLRIFHPTKSAEEIARKVELEVSVSQTVGRSRMTPKGAKLDGVYAQTYLLFDLKKDKDQDVEEVLRNLLREMSPGKIAYFSELTATGGRIEFFVGLFCNGGNIGFQVDAELVRMLASAGIALCLDIYS